MEEILSSIRRIIADDETGPPAAGGRCRVRAPACAVPSDDEEDDDVLELTEVVEPPRAGGAAAGPPAADQRPSLAERPPRAEPPSRSTHHDRPQASDSLISPGAASASTNAFAKLARASAAERREHGAGFGELSVEQLLRRPADADARDWLDQNLPAIVERVVEQEVKKLARRAELIVSRRGPLG